MNKSTFDDLLTHIQSLERQVCDDGQREYAQDNDNVFANFDRVGGRVKCEHCHHSIGPKAALMVYLLKHLDGIESYLGGHTSQREDVTGRIKDIRLYLGLLWGMIERERGQGVWTTIDELIPSDDCENIIRSQTEVTPWEDTVQYVTPPPLATSVDWREVNEGMEDLIANGLPPKGPDNLTFGLGDILPRLPKVSTNDGDVHLNREEPHHYTCDCCECNRY